MERLRVGRLRVRVPMKSLVFLIGLSIQPHYGPGVISASNRNEYQGSSWGESAVGAKGLNLTVFCEPII
jgi:hypothetical protein